MHTLLLIPWIYFGFKNKDVKTLGLNQTAKSLLFLLLIEVLYWLILMAALDKPNPNIAGSGSFAWTYFFIYEKGIFPCFYLADAIEGSLGDKIDNYYPVMYLVTALIIDYIILF